MVNGACLRFSFSSGFAVLFPCCDVSLAIIISGVIVLCARCFLGDSLLSTDYRPQDLSLLSEMIDDGLAIFS